MNQMTELYNNLDRVMAMAQYEMIGISVGVVRAEKEDAPGLLVNLSVHYAWKGDVADMGTQMAAILCSRYASSGYKLDDAKWPPRINASLISLLVAHHVVSMSRQRSSAVIVPFFNNSLFTTPSSTTRANYCSALYASSSPLSPSTFFLSPAHALVCLHMTQGWCFHRSLPQSSSPPGGIASLLPTHVVQLDSALSMETLGMESLMRRLAFL